MEKEGLGGTPIRECLEPAMSNYAKEPSTACKDWHRIESAPKNKDVMLMARNAAGDTFLMLRPARLTNQGWVYASTGKPIEVEPLM
jgi:hypothetical protein